MSDFEERVRDLMGEVAYREGYAIDIEWDKAYGNRLYMQVRCWRPDVVTGTYDWGYGGKRYLSEYMTDGEILRIAFASCMAYEEHEVREFFKYRGRSIFGPHIDPLALWEVADRLDVRS